ncbi:unnamed protein product [Microthlaspi erraticum]|uniref:PUM-HD domain-containing protein n=1 Tax=Microthlaspi erraticum TaxID=1685480 RepID=A0A6D2K251_9BRAS|nr:unnamed protein product [Microthlaspi erraticum]
MTNLNGGDVHPLTDSSSSPSQQLRLRAYQSIYGILDDYLPVNQASSFSPLSDLQNLESNFRRLGVSDLNARQQQLLSNNRGSNQFPLETGDQSMISVREHFNPSHVQQQTQRELINQSQRLWFPNDNRVHGYGAMGSLHTGLGDVSFSPSYRFVDQSPWGFSQRTNHDTYTVSDPRATMLSRAKDRVESLQLQSMIDQGSRETIDKIFGDLVSHVCELMIDPFGHQVFRKLLEKCSEEQITQVLGMVIQKPIQFVRVCGDANGNYVVQYVLELEDCQVADALSRYLDGNYVQLACDKYGSHAVQKFLKNRQFNTRRIVQELLCDIDSLLVNPYGNYVIQTAWSVSQDDMQGELLYHINRNHPFMRCNRYGRKVLEKLKIWT